MTTPMSTNTAYASGSDLRNRHDFRQLGDLLNDDGTRVTSAASFDSNAEVTTALMDASGMIESACFKANKYTVADLQQLAGASRNLLTKLCVELTWWALYDRRHSGKPMLPSAMWAFSVLDDLEKGSRIFGLQENANAGNPSDGYMTAADWNDLGLATDVAKRFYGKRGKYYRPLGSAGGCSDDCG